MTTPPLAEQPARVAEAQRIIEEWLASARRDNPPDLGDLRDAIAAALHAAEARYREALEALLDTFTDRYVGWADRELQARRRTAAILASGLQTTADAEVEAVADMHREIVALTGWATMAEIEPKEAAFQDALRRLAAERAMHKNNALNWQDACNKADDAVAAAVAADNGHE
jgi:hypothetical protein